MIETAALEGLAVALGIGVLHFVDPPYIGASRPKSTGALSAYAHDDFDHAAFVDQVKATKHADVLVTHYPHPLFDEGPWRCVGDYESHRNVPNGEGRTIAMERLYRFIR